MGSWEGHAAALNFNVFICKIEIMFCYEAKNEKSNLKCSIISNTKNCYFQEMLINITIIIGTHFGGSQIFINKYSLSSLHCTQCSARHH